MDFRSLPTASYEKGKGSRCFKTLTAKIAGLVPYSNAALKFNTLCIAKSRVLSIDENSPFSIQVLHKEAT